MTYYNTEEALSFPTFDWKSASAFLDTGNKSESQHVIVTLEALRNIVMSQQLENKVTLAHKPNWFAGYMGTVGSFHIFSDAYQQYEDRPFSKSGKATFSVVPPDHKQELVVL